MQLSYQVDYSDLDLTTQAGTVALEQRVHDAAKAACEELGKLYPFSTPDDFECTRVTVKRAEPKLREVLAQAGKQ